jgi:hypothetical protein
MSIPMVRLGNIASWGNRKGGVQMEREAKVDIQKAELWDGEGVFSTFDVAPTRNKWNESRWFDVITVVVVALISITICYMFGWM